MNKQLWKLYKESPQGKACIELFDPDVENTSEGAFNIWKHASKWGEDEVEDSFADELAGMFWLWSSNLSERGFIPEEWTKESFDKFAALFGHSSLSLAVYIRESQQPVVYASAP